MKLLNTLLLITLFGLLAACAGPNPYGNSTDQYTRGEVNQIQHVRYGVITGLQPVTIDSEGNAVGTVAGGLLGGIAGSSVGGGKGRAATTVAGAVLGGYLGNKAQGALNKTNGVQITIQMDNGEVQSIVQETNANSFFRRGDRVKVIGGYSGKTRVVR
ncbi:MAG: hypothetical protein A6F71_05990 [Cycloclasticus sp. symbiont of Poecilosclerida sp. M]|nr:MAG: hypothetical protein A6F71_05990 [Cycloclasticus sp. symbiont of Poecilosclerida sp. M]